MSPTEMRPEHHLGRQGWGLLLLVVLLLLLGAGVWVLGNSIGSL
jgi:hypothetical protein